METNIIVVVVRTPVYQDYYLSDEFAYCILAHLAQRSSYPIILMNIKIGALLVEIRASLVLLNLFRDTETSYLFSSLSTLSRPVGRT